MVFYVIAASHPSGEDADIEKIIKNNVLGTGAKCNGELYTVEVSFNFPIYRQYDNNFVNRLKNQSSRLEL
jgi:hypothetical protein